MSHYADDLYHRTSLRLSQVLPNFIENEYPLFVDFLRTYYEFLEQYDVNPSTPTFQLQSGVITVVTNESVINGTNTTFSTLKEYQKIRVGTEEYTVRSIQNDVKLTIYEIPSRTQYGVTFLAETNKSLRQASGAIRQILTIHDVNSTLPDFIGFFRDTFLRDLPQGLTQTEYLIPRILDFYRSRGSEDSYRFLFRILFGEDKLNFYYPYELTFKTSDGIYQVPQVLRVRRESIQYGSEIQRLTSNVYALTGREIIGLTSNTRARIAEVREEFNGPFDIVSLLLEDVTQSTETFNLLLDSAETLEIPERLLFSTYGTPPKESFRQIYQYVSAIEKQTAATFAIDESISTLPLLDPSKIEAIVSGSVTGFKIVNGGRDFQYGDLIFVPPNFNGGYGAVGRVTGFSNTEVEQVNVVTPGFGYYVGLPLIVDDDGTGGGGLAGRVSEIANTISTYERPVLISDAVVTTLLSEDPDFNLDCTPLSLDDPTAIDPDETYRILQEPVLINYVDWSSGNTSSGLYLANLATTISTVLDFQTVEPFFINGKQVPIGEVAEIEVTIPGTNYFIKLPTVSVQTPVRPVTARRVEISTSLIPFEVAEVEPIETPGKISSVEVVAGGAGYGSASWNLLAPVANAGLVYLQTEVDDTGLIYKITQEPDYQEEDAFTINASTQSITTSSIAGNNAIIGIATGGVVSGQSRFKDSRGCMSNIYRLQDDRVYQPFSYVLNSEQPYQTYKEIVKRFVHPAGRLLLAEHTLTANINTHVTILDTEIQTGLTDLVRLVNTGIFTISVPLIANLTSAPVVIPVTAAVCEITLPAPALLIVDTEPCELLRVIVDQDFETGMSLATYGYTVSGVVTNVNGAGRTGSWGAQTGGNTYNQYYSGFTIPSDTFCPDGAVTIWSDTSAADEYTTGAPLIELRDTEAFLSIYAGLGTNNAALQLNARLDGVVQTNVNSVSDVVTRGTYQKFQVCWSMATFNESNVLNADGWIRLYVDNVLVLRVEDVPFHSNSGSWPTVYVGPMGAADSIYFGETAHPCDATRVAEPMTITVTAPAPSDVPTQQFIPVTAAVVTVYRILPLDILLPGVAVLDTNAVNVITTNEIVTSRLGMLTDAVNVITTNEIVTSRLGMLTETANITLSGDEPTISVTIPNITITIDVELYDVTFTQGDPP